MLLFDSPSLIALNLELRLSMRKLLQDLCRELQDDYADLVSQLAFPTDYLQFLSRTVNAEDLSNWKVVGWIESLNDFVYFLDIWQQWRGESDRREFAEQLFAECQENFRKQLSRRAVSQRQAAYQRPGRAARAPLQAIGSGHCARGPVARSCRRGSLVSHAQGVVVERAGLSGAEL